MQEYRFMAEEEQDGDRIDRFLSDLMESQSRNYLQRLIKDGYVTINQKTVKPSSPVKAGDEVLLMLPEPLIPEIKPQNIPLDIVYEDDDLLIINKQKGQVVHPAPGHYEDTIVNGILYHCNNLSGINGVLRPGIVHRIDKDTTGLLIICKNDTSHKCIAEQLKEHSIERTYHAIVWGNFPLKNEKNDENGIYKDTINAPIGRDPKDRKKMAIRPDGKSAITHYEVLEQFNGFSYIKCNLETGRTHQIRVHMTSIGHPLAGDLVYGIRKCNFHTEGQTLHAKTIGFKHPRTGEWMQFDSGLPEYFSKILKTLEIRA